MSVVPLQLDQLGFVRRVLRAVTENLVIEVLSTADADFADKIVNAVAPTNAVAGGLAVASVTWAELRRAVVTVIKALDGELEPDQYQPLRATSI